MQQVTGAPVLMSRTDAEQARFFWDEGSDTPEVLAELYARHGLSEDWTSRIPDISATFRKWVEPHPEPTFIQGGRRSASAIGSTRFFTRRGTPTAI